MERIAYVIGYTVGRSIGLLSTPNGIAFLGCMTALYIFTNGV